MLSAHETGARTCLPVGRMANLVRGFSWPSTQWQNMPDPIAKCWGYRVQLRIVSALSLKRSDETSCDSTVIGVIHSTRYASEPLMPYR